MTSSGQGRSEVTVVVFLADLDADHERQTADAILQQFDGDVNSGLLTVLWVSATTQSAIRSQLLNIIRLLIESHLRDMTASCDCENYYGFTDIISSRFWLDWFCSISIRTFSFPYSRNLESDAIMTSWLSDNSVNAWTVECLNYLLLFLSFSGFYYWIHETRTVVIDDFGVCLSRGFAVQTRLSGSRSYLEWRLLGP